MYRKSLSILLSELVFVSLIMLVSCSKDKSDGPSTAPEVTTTTPNNIAQTSADCGGDVTSDGGVSVTARGVCWGANPIPTIDDNITTNGTGQGSFTCSLAGLTGQTLYYIRAYATNSVGTGYGEILSFTTTDSVGTLIDIDGNTCRTVKINGLWWMAENLRVTHYRNGIAIPNEPDSAAWGNLSTDAYCNINNSASAAAIYGKLYNFYAVNDTSLLAPAGWHVASDAEWQNLINIAGGDAIAGGKLKEAGLAHWITPNEGATNEFGFTALPGGFRFESGQFYGLQAHGNFWTSTGASGVTAYYRFMHCTNAEVAHFTSGLKAGFAVRCVKDY
jgi:uncharacterized protein (TIGR02145 family)